MQVKVLNWVENPNKKALKKFQKVYKMELLADLDTGSLFVGADGNKYNFTYQVDENTIRVVPESGKDKGKGIEKPIDIISYVYRPVRKSERMPFKVFGLEEVLTTYKV